MKRTYFALCAGLILLSFPLRAISFWEGTAVASSYGEFPSAGLYAACSSFPRNSVVEVTNLENGKSVQVLVTRSLDNPGVFIALSPEAASQLLIQIGMVARVKVSLPQSGADGVLRADSPGMSQDPDLNPQALVARERQKEDSGLALAAPEDIQPERTPAPMPTKAPVAVLPKPTPSPGSARPDVIGSQRPQPSGRDLAVKAKDLPDTPLSEKTPTAVEAKTASSVPDAASARKSEQPEALARASVYKGEYGQSNYDLDAPELEAGQAAVKASASVYERPSLTRPQGAAVAEGLAEPPLEQRGKPEGALTRMKAPSPSPGMATAMASPELDGSDGAETATETGPQKAEAYEIAQKGLMRMSGEEQAALALPEVGDSGIAGATAEERLVVIKRASPETDLSSLALADPRLTEEPSEEEVWVEPEGLAEDFEDTELVSADERLLVGRRSAGEETSLALSDPEFVEAAEERAVRAEERLLASRRVPTPEASLALADPEMGAPAADMDAIASVDEKFKATARKGAEVSFSIPDPDMTDVAIAAADENAPPEALASLGRPKGKTPAAVQTALAKPELAPEEKISGPEVAEATRPETDAGSARDILVFEKQSPDLALAEEKKPVEPERTEPTKVEPLVAKPETAKPEIVESYRKGAEALVALNARRMDGLSKGIYYVQVGVYKTGQGAAQAVRGLTPDYPLAYQEVESKESMFYRVLIGPIKKDESGIVLYRLKSMGFKDAFVRKGD